MSFAVKEIFYSLQGEGANVGRSAVFCRFAGCNLWSGQEEDRATAECWFCDTDFVGTDGDGGGRFISAADLADAVDKLWPANGTGRKLVVCTGGEPLLQLTAPLIDAFHARGFEVAVESNGTIVPPPGIDWLTVSPKAGTELLARSGQELKLVYPQAGLEGDRLDELERLDFDHFFLQPVDGPERARYTEMAAETCLLRPKWRLSLQIHKILGLR